MAPCSSSAVGNFTTSPIHRLAHYLSEEDESERKRQLLEFFDIADDSFADKLWKSYEICCRGLSCYPSSGELLISFNGGKDACVVLYLWLAAAAARKMVQQGSETQWAVESLGQTILYFDSQHEFPQITNFVDWIVKSLGLRMVTVKERSFKMGMEDVVGQGGCAVVMGQRHGDPWTANITAFEPSSEGWPQFVRINPILDWSYSHVWTFLRGVGLPYCTLYDEGYTSLGDTQNTLPNPALRLSDGSYAPAYKLEDGSLERAGRVSAVNDIKTNKEGVEKRAESNATATPLPAVAAAA